MKIVYFIFLLIPFFAFSQTNKNILYSNSLKLSIKDNGVLKKDEWTIMPQIKPDIYITKNKNTRIVFYSDIDSISFFSTPNKDIQFNVILNKKDTALTKIVYQRPYIEILKDASDFDTLSGKKNIKFKYQSKKNKHLKELREKYKLDSIIGNGNDVSKLINLMNWLHNTVPHNGSDGNPKIKNADDMLSVCSIENRGLNCRGLAIVYNEFCLSLGYKSRYVTCLPKDSLNIDNDCHVINMVFVKNLNKWLWIDPTFNAYVTSENDELLSIEEVRYNLINDIPMKINKDANWNNKEDVNIDYYLKEYMAKNLYTIQCPIKSKFNNETHLFWKILLNKLNFVQLVPLDYTKDISSLYIKPISKPKIFWKKPE